MKLLFFVSSLQQGGAERVVTTLANEFIKDNKVIIVTLSRDVKDFYEANDNIERVYVLESSIRYNKLQVLYIIKKMSEILNNHNPDVAISFINKLNILSIIAARMSKTPLIISERNFYYSLKSKAWRLARKIIYPFSDGMVILSKYDFNKYNFVKNKRMIVNPIGIDVPKDVDLIRREKIILAVGTLNNQKGFDMLIRACSKIDLKDWKVVILGEGPERGNLECLIKALSLTGSIFLPGRKENVSDYYQKSSIFVLSSRFEGFPNVLAEAMSSGCACIAFDCKTGPSEMIEDNQNGFLVNAGDIDALSERINCLINNDSRVNEISKEGRKLIERLDVTHIANAWLTYIKETLESKRT